MKKRTLLFLLLFLSYYQFIFSQSGAPDPGFGVGGVVKTYPATPGPNSSTSAKEGLLQADGKLILGLLANGKTKLTRLLANGTVDASYANNGYSVAVSMIITAGALQADGKIVVAGSTNGQSDFMLTRYNTDGTLDASFGNSGVVITTQFPATFSFLISVSIAADGKIIAAGQTGPNGVMVCYNSNGTIDSGFGANGLVLTSFPFSDASTIQAVAFQPDGKIVAVGGVYNTNFSDFLVARYNADGSPDHSFNGTGHVRTDFSLNDVARAVVLSNDGKIYAGGSSADGAGVAHFTVVRYHSNGAQDMDFNAPSGRFTTVFGSGYEYLNNLALQSDGKIVAGGHVVGDPTGDIALVRINANGTIDNSFGTNGNGQLRADIDGSDEESAFLAIQPDGKIVTGGGSFTFTSGFQSRYTSFRYNADGTPDGGYGNGGLIAVLLPDSFIQYSAVGQQADGKVLAVSEESGLNNNVVRLRRFFTNGSPDNSFGQNGSVALANHVISVFQPDGKLLDLGFLESNSGDIVLFRYNADGTPDAGFGNNGTVITDLGGIESAGSAAFQPDGKIIIGGLARDDNGSDFLVVRYNADGTIDQGFGTNGFTRVDVTPEESTMTIAVGPDGKIVFGGTGITFPPHHTIFQTFSIMVRLNANGTIDNGFADQGKKIMNRSTTEAFGSLAIQADNKIVFTSYTTENPIPMPYLERLNLDGSTDNSFGQTGTIQGYPAQVALQADQKILVFGAKKNNLNNNVFALARFTTNGNPDLSFGTNGQSQHSFAALDNFFFASHLAGNNLYVAGGGSDEFGSNVGMIARFIVGCPAPDITAISVSPTSLWPPNHTMKNIAVNYTVSATCALADTQIVVSSNEPVQTGEAGDLAPDWEIVNDHLVKVRAERSINGNGRIYTIMVIVTDINGNKDTASATVTVPKSQGNPGDQNLLITVYPNPSPNHFNVVILSKSSEKIKVRVLNNSGKVVRTIGNLKPYQLFRIGDDLSKGIYFIEATQGSATKTTKIIKL